MEPIKKLCKEIQNEEITIISSRPANGKVQVLLNILYELGIKQNQKILMFHMEETIQYYEQKLISLISNIEESEIKHYFHPCNIYKKEFTIQKEPFIKAIEELKTHQIHMCELYSNIYSIDILDYLLDYDSEKNANLIIIQSLDQFLKKSNYKIEQLLKKIKRYARQYHTHFIILSNLKREASEKDIHTIIDVPNYKIIKKYAGTMIQVYRKKEQRMYTNHLVLQINKQNS